MTNDSALPTLREALGEGLVERPVAGDRPLVLDDPSAVVVTVGLPQELFLVERGDGPSGTGQRAHVATCPVGQLLLGGAPVQTPDGTSALLLTSAAGGIAWIGSLAQLLARGADERWGPSIAAAVDGFVTLMLGAVDDGRGTARCRAVGPGDDLRNEALEPLCATRGVVWLPLDEVAEQDAAQVGVGAEKAPLWPVTERHGVAGRGTGVGLTTEQLLRRADARAVLSAFQVAIAAALQRRRAERERARGALDQASLSSDRAVLSEALGRLAAVGRGERPIEATGASEPLRRACERVAEDVGAKIHVGTPAADTLGAMQGALARLSGARARPILLEGRWFEDDCGSLLGFVLVEGERVRPVALLPRGRGYQLVEPTDGRRRPLDATLAEQLHPQAYQFYSPFPNRPLGPLDVLRHAAQRTYGDLLLVAGLGMVAGAIGVAIPLLTGQIFDHVVPSGQRGLLLELVFLLGGVLAGQAALDVTRSFALVRTQTRMDATLEAAVWDRLLRLPLPFFRRYTAGDLAARAAGIGHFRDILAGATLSGLLAAVFSVWNLVFLFTVDLRLALAALGLVGIAAGVAAVAIRYSVRRQRIVAELDGRLGGLLLQLVSGVAKLRVTGAESRAFTVWARLFSARRKADLDAEWVHVRIAAFQSAFPLVTSGVLYWLVAHPVGPRLSAGQYLAFAAAFGAFLHAVLGCIEAALATLLVQPLYERARPVLTEPTEPSDGTGERIELSGAIEVSHVTFRYAEGTSPVLRDVSLRVEPGEFVALVGPSGSGKSTLLRVLLGFELPESGAVLYDGRPLTSLDVRHVRHQIGVVTQNSRVMAGDIFTNIVGSSGLAIDDAWRAARAAALDKDIEAMPMGMHTVISQGGGTFSGGQRQRLLIARALAMEPRLLFFDEATSALDNVTQAAVSASLEGLHVTRVVIAHRLSTIRHADKIVVVDQGRVVQVGRYDELVAVEGPFRTLAERQTL